MIAESLVCLALNVYYEARDQPIEGQIAVTNVVMNRVADPRFPNTPCKVIKEGVHSKITGRPLRWKCQFTWYCDGKKDKPHDLDAYRWAQIIAQHVGFGKAGDITSGSTHYHAVSVNPIWNIKKTKIGRIGDHIFYRWEK
tara:strand:- start:606 stop:1025 length:420 start_codon:yes stop_codon:yes gene_type:complete